MRRFLTGVTLALLAVLALAGCGGHHHRTPVQKLKAAHPCTPANYYMQCAAGASGQLLGHYGANSSSQFGIDFAWGGPYGPVARRYGARYGISYLSGTSKDWTATRAHSYTAAGLGVVFVYETAANRVLSGCAGGAVDAQRAASEEAALGYAGAPAYFAADFDTSGYSLHGTVGEYYRCARARLGARAGAYGGVRTMQIAAANGYPSRRLWQTLAWSYGHWTSACLRQYSINSSWHGYSVDFDVAVCADYGQAGGAPAPKPKPKPRPSKAQVARWTRARNASQRAYIHRGCQVLAQRERWFARRLTGRLAARHHRALAATRTVYQHRSCSVFARRVAYYQRKLAGR